MAATGFGIQEGPAAVQVKTERADIHHITSRRGEKQRWSEASRVQSRHLDSGDGSRSRTTAGRGISGTRHAIDRHIETVTIVALRRKNNQEKCMYRKFRCHKCGRLGHLPKRCRTRRVYCLENNNNANSDTNSGDEIFYNVNERSNEGLFHLGSGRYEPVMFKVKVNGQLMSIELDSGAGTSVCSEKNIWNFSKMCLYNGVI